GLVQPVTVLLAGCEARSLADGAVDIVDAPAAAAHQVVVVVAGATFVTGRVACRLDPADQTRARTREEHVIDGLGGHRPDAFPHTSADLVGRSVRMVGEPLQHRPARSGNPEPRLTKLI